MMKLIKLKLAAFCIWVRSIFTTSEDNLDVPPQPIPEVRTVSEMSGGPNIPSDSFDSKFTDDELSAALVELRTSCEREYEDLYDATHNTPSVKKIKKPKAKKKRKSARKPNKSRNNP